jgi:hypothetical protein
VRPLELRKSGRDNIIEIPIEFDSSNIETKKGGKEIAHSKTNLQISKPISYDKRHTSS